jgi:phospho-N-acetylmuramoyl-pentapeptide-transferase
MRSVLFGAGFALAFTLFMTPVFIRLFERLGWGQFIRDDGPQSHHTKRGTPTMGGIVIILGAVVGYLLGHLIEQYPPTVSGLLVVLMMTGMGVVGFIDDYTKTRNQRSLGLGGWAKIFGQAIVATTFAILAINFPDSHGVTPASTAVSAVRDISWLNFAIVGGIVGIGLFIVWVNLIVISTANGVNVADGLDGLASGSAILSITSYVVIGFWQFNQSCFAATLDPEVAY